MKVTHYLNQFFAGLGSEEAARTPPARIEGAVGPGRGLGLAISYTISCGDDYFGEHEEGALAAILDMLTADRPDVVVCGPAFAAGRYGYACGRIAAAAESLGIPAVAGMEPENPGVAAARGRGYIVPTGAGVGGMRDALARMATLAECLARGETPDAAEDAFLPRRRAGRFVERSAADRAVDLLLAKLDGDVTTEIALRDRRLPAAAPLQDLSSAVVALVTEAACVPAGNPDRLPRHRAESWHAYPIEGLGDLAGFESVHGGFDTTAANADPHRIVPLDAAHAMAEELIAAGVAAVILTGT
jgi:betaine reductase